MKDTLLSALESALTRLDMFDVVSILLLILLLSILGLLARAIAKLVTDSISDQTRKHIVLWWIGLASERKRGQILLILCIFILLAMKSWPTVAAHLRINNDIVQQLLRDECWIGYVPRGYVPGVREPDEASISGDLARIRSAGFTGIVSYGSEGGLEKIPRLAHRQGLAVIMGVWDPKNRRELNNAARNATWVDAYVVGHNGLYVGDKGGGRKVRAYTETQLRHALSALRRATSRPVATTLVANDYNRDHSLALIGDWIFPDINPSIEIVPPDDGATLSPEDEINRLINMAEDMQDIARKVERPVMLKMVMYPHSGVTGASVGNQSDFFEAVQHVLRTRLRLPVVYHSAFDQPWKSVDLGYEPWDPHTGLLTADGHMRPAARTITKNNRCPP